MKTSSLADVRVELMKSWRFRFWYYLLWPKYCWFMWKTKIARHLSGIAMNGTIAKGNEMGKGLIRVSYDFLRQALHLPEDTIILAVRDAQDNFRMEHGTFLQIKLVHSDLPAANEFEILRFYDPQFGSVLEDGEHYVTKFLAWNE